MDIWSNGIRADGDEATSEQLDFAWRSWTRGRRHTSGALASALTAAGAGHELSRWRNYRIADRMLQKARKAGLVRYVSRGRCWEIVEGSTQ